MDSVSDEILELCGMGDFLMHYGTPRHSGRYQWGSGEHPFQHSGDFLSRVKELKDEGLSEKEIAEAIGLTTTQLRIQKSLANSERRSAEVAMAKQLRDEGYSLNQIAEKMGYKNDSSIRSLLNEDAEARMNQARKTAENLKRQIAEKGIIDVGTGVERELGVSKEKLEEALYILELEGYPVYGGGVPQVTNPGKQTNIKVVGPPGTEHKDMYDYENVHSVGDYISYDGDETFKKSFVYPESMDSSRLKIKYAEEGGIDKDGVIEIRRGVPDLSLGESHYAQVRILVDGTHYLKGMAIYSDDLPDGVDVLFNTNKKQGAPMTDVLKKIKYSASAKATYKEEVASLDRKLDQALRNAPRERQAQVIANATVKAKKQDNPEMSKGELKKAKQQALTAARERVGAKRTPIEIDDKEWEAIQSGAIAPSKLKQILNNTDIDTVRERATPRTKTTLSNAKISKISSMSASGYTIAEIAKALGVSTSTVSKYLK